MVRLLVFVTCIFFGWQGFATEAIYFSDAEKALVSLLLKTTDTEIPVREQAVRLKKTIEGLQKISKDQPEVIEVKSYPEFLELQKNLRIYGEHKLNELSDDQLIQRLKRKSYVSPSLRVMKKIDAYEAARLQTMQKITMFLGSKGLQLGQLELLNIESIRTEVQNSFNEKVESLTSSLSEKKTAEGVVLSRLLKSYFKNLPTSQKTEILYRVIQMPLNSTPIDLFLVMIQSAGPQLQKLVQIMGRSEQIPEEFKAIFQKLESQVKPVPWWKVARTLAENGVDLADFVYFEREPVGVGTMAQTHRAQYLDKNGRRQNSVIRILKPGIDRDLEMDHQVLIKATVEIDADPEVRKFNLPLLADLVEDLHKSVAEELDFSITVKNQTAAREFYKRSETILFNQQKMSLEFNVPRTMMYAAKDVMIQDLVIGKKPSKEFSAYNEIYPDLYRVVAEKVAEVWIEEAFFKSGFFHADLHQGNILSLVTDQSVTIHILDFGMVGHLNSQLRNSALLLALGIKLDRADLITNNFLKLSKMNNDQLTGPKLLRLVQARIDQLRLNSDLGGSLDAWTAWALDHGIELHYEFLKLNRGLSAIEGMLDDSKSQVSFQQIAQKVALKNKFYVSQLLMRDAKLKLEDYTKLVAAVLGKPDVAPVQVKALQCHSLFN